MILFPNAKINLGLNIIEKRKDGYHNLETVFYPIPLQDALEVKVRNRESENISVETIPQGCCTQKTVTDDYTLRITGTQIAGSSEDNLVIKAYRLLKKEFEIPPLTIHMYKHIPSGAGLGGGSSDAAFMMRLLNDKFGLGLSSQDMEKRIGKLGADCAFFISNQPVFATGIGTEMSPINISLEGYYLLLVKPDIFISTQEAYTNITPQKPNFSLSEIIKEPIEHWRDLMKNDFEQHVFICHPEIAAIKDKLYDLGATYASMSGSGSSVFGIFKSPIEHAEDIFNGCFCRQRKL